LSLIGAWAETRRLHHASLWSVAVDVETFGQRRTHAQHRDAVDGARSSIPALGYTVPYAIGNILLTAWGPVLIALMSKAP
jgi:hypothetical protein